MSVWDATKRVLIGPKLASTRLGETLLPKRIALPVFASDALSSVAYAPDEILITLSLAGMAGFAFSLPVALAVAAVMLIVVASYRQVVHAYPSGGGDYEVATVNLGPNAGLTVASALLVDYVLTVAVSVSSGIQNAKAMFPVLAGREGIFAALVILLIMATNLRGVRESGTVFAIPTYAFMISVGAMVAWGFTQILLLGRHLRAETADYTVVGPPEYDPFIGFVVVMLLARTFSSGCAALTGVEAISNGVPNFKKPKSKNAATTLLLLGTMAVSMLLGIVAMARITGVKMLDVREGAYFVTPAGEQIHKEATTVMGQLAQVVFYDSFRPGFYFLMTVTVVILFLAANTAFNGFPTLASILAKDGYLPHQLHTRGDRLAFSNGILMLAGGAIALVMIFNASVTMLIQMYVVGVFISFTLSQTGMVRHWTRHLRSEGDPATRAVMRRSRAINTVGLVATGTVLVVVLISKFIHGAWMAILAMVVIFGLMKMIHRHYDLVAHETALDDVSDRALPSRVRAVVLVNTVNKPTVKALQFARATMPSSLEAVTVAVDADETTQLIEKWDAEDLPVRLRVIDSPYRQITQPFIDYVKQIRSDNPRDVVCIYIPEYVVGHWYESVLHNQTALLIRARLHFMPGVMVTSVPYQLGSGQAHGRRQAAAEQQMKEAHAQRVDRSS